MARKVGICATLAVVCLYVMIFPTLISAMTGYSATMEPYVQDPANQNDMMSLNGLYYNPMLVMASGPLIWLADYIAFGYLDLGEALSHADVHTMMFYACNAPALAETGTVAQNLTIAADGFTLHASGSSSIHVCNKTYDPGPSPLIIDINHVLWPTPWSYPNGSINTTVAPGSVIGTKEWLPINSTAILIDNIVAASTCIPMKTYQWGFSGRLLLGFVPFTGGYWTLICMLFRAAYEHSQTGRYTVIWVVYRDAWDLVEELKAKFRNTLA